MSKLPHIGTSIFTVMSQMATEHQAINLSQGFPNFPVDERLTAILAKLATANVHQYTPMSGLPSLLDKIAVLTQQSYGRAVTPKEVILITAGATEGIFATIQALVKAQLQQQAPDLYSSIHYGGYAVLAGTDLAVTNAMAALPPLA